MAAPTSVTMSSPIIAVLPAGSPSPSTTAAKKAGSGFPNTKSIFACRVLYRYEEGTHVELQPVGASPVAGAAEANEPCAAVVDQTERSVE